MSTMSVNRPLTCLVALCLVAAACSSTAAPSSSAAPSGASVASASASAAASPSVKPTPTPAPTPTPEPTAVALTLNAHVWWGGYEIDVSGATYDPLKRKLLITATFLNTSTAANDVSGLGPELNVFWNSTYLPGFIPLGAVPAGGTVKAEIQVGPPTGFTPETAVLTFGQPGGHQATVPLNGDPAVSEQPTPLTVSGDVKMGAFVMFSVASGTVIPASCAGSPAKIKYGPIAKGEVSIVLGGVATNSGPSDGFIDQAFLDVPDGTTSAGNPAVYIPLASKATVRDNGLCFKVPAPGSGAYTLTMHEISGQGERVDPLPGPLNSPGDPPRVAAPAWSIPGDGAATGLG